MVVRIYSESCEGDLPATGPIWFVDGEYDNASWMPFSEAWKRIEESIVRVGTTGRPTAGRGGQVSGIAGAIPVLKGRPVEARGGASIHRHAGTSPQQAEELGPRARVPGVYGRCLGECDAPGVWLIDVPIDTLADYPGATGA